MSLMVPCHPQNNMKLIAPSHIDPNALHCMAGDLAEEASIKVIQGMNLKLHTRPAVITYPSPSDLFPEELTRVLKQRRAEQLLT